MTFPHKCQPPKPQPPIASPSATKTSRAGAQRPSGVRAVGVRTYYNSSGKKVHDQATQTPNSVIRQMKENERKNSSSSAGRDII